MHITIFTMYIDNPPFCSLLYSIAITHKQVQKQYNHTYKASNYMCTHAFVMIDKVTIDKVMIYHKV